MPKPLWILEHLEDEKFPYRVRIEGWRPEPFCLRAQDRWPNAGRSLFCLRENGPPPDKILAEAERVEIVSIREFGKRLTIVLDRGRNKRCDFLFLSKEYRGRPGESYEQIFWHTQAFLQKRRPGAKLSLSAKPQGLTVVIDSRERYPWSFPGQTLRRVLPVGDYALQSGDQYLAVVERKTFENLLAEFGQMAAFHQQLQELELYVHPAVAVEAGYADFLNPKKQSFYAPAFCAKALAEMAARHPRVQFAFCENRKLAAEWTRQFFAAASASYAQSGGKLVLGVGVAEE